MKRYLFIAILFFSQNSFPKEPTLSSLFFQPKAEKINFRFFAGLNSESQETTISKQQKNGTQYESSLHYGITNRHSLKFTIKGEASSLKSNTEKTNQDGLSSAIVSYKGNLPIRKDLRTFFGVNIDFSIGDKEVSTESSTASRGFNTLTPYFGTTYNLNPSLIIGASGWIDFNSEKTLIDKTGLSTQIDKFDIGSDIGLSIFTEYNFNKATIGLSLENTITGYNLQTIDNGTLISAEKTEKIAPFFIKAYGSYSLLPNFSLLGKAIYRTSFQSELNNGTEDILVESFDKFEITAGISYTF